MIFLTSYLLGFGLITIATCVSVIIAVIVTQGQREVVFVGCVQAMS